MAIPSGAVEQPGENSNTEHAVEHALARGDVEPSGGKTQHNGGGHQGAKVERPANHQQPVERMVRPAVEPEENQYAGHEQRRDHVEREPVPPFALPGSCSR